MPEEPASGGSPTPTRTFEATVELTVRITINDQSIIARCVDNHDHLSVPQPDVKGGTGWRNTFYNLTSSADVIEMLAFNWVVNNRAAHQLDGWADLVPDWEAPYAAYEVVDHHADIDVREVAT